LNRKRTTAVINAKLRGDKLTFFKMPKNLLTYSLILKMPRATFNKNRAALTRKMINEVIANPNPTTIPTKYSGTRIYDNPTTKDATRAVEKSISLSLEHFLIRIKLENTVTARKISPKTGSISSS
jgi:hypothetical protein